MRCSAILACMLIAILGNTVQGKEYSMSTGLIPCNMICNKCEMIPLINCKNPTCGSSNTCTCDCDENPVSDFGAAVSKFLTDLLAGKK